jgi:hypothetical protein
MKEQTRVLIYLFFATVVVASCSERPSPMAPAPNDTELVPQVALTGCPSIDEVCAEVKPIVEAACPPDGAYRNNGERHKCQKQAFDEAVKAYKHCFSKAEINAIRRSVLHGAGGPLGKASGDQFYQEPGTVQ